MSQQGFYGVGGMCGLREDRNLGSRSCTDVNADGGRKWNAQTSFLEGNCCCKRCCYVY